MGYTAKHSGGESQPRLHILKCAGERENVVARQGCERHRDRVRVADPYSFLYLQTRLRCVLDSHMKDLGFDSVVRLICSGLRKAPKMPHVTVRK